MQPPQSSSNKRNFQWEFVPFDREEPAGRAQPTRCSRTPLSVGLKSHQILLFTLHRPE